MSQKKALIITYYWPPSGGSGVQRWLKFAKYLREFGWEPIIYTPSNPEYPSEDNSFLKDIPENILVIKRPIKEPYTFYKILTGKKRSNKIQVGFINESKTNSFFEKVSRWLRGNLFIPDARKFWIKPSIKFLSKWLIENPVDIVVSTGPPHSMHLIALGLKKKLNIKWVADFRDPWTQIDFYQHLMLTKRADNKHKKLERTVIENADIVVTISKNSAIDLNKIVNRKIEVITNGFDTDDFLKCPKYEYDSFSITHLGSMNSDRNPSALWIALRDILIEDSLFKESLKIRFIGKTDFSVFSDIEKYDLTGYIENHNYLPHEEALNIASNSAILLLPLNNTHNVKSIATGKIYEYLALKRPILCIGHKDGDAANIIQETQSGATFNFEESESIKSLLKEKFEQYKNKTLEITPENTNRFSRKELTSKMTDIFAKQLEN
jgi:glycosyltransferase involved in cell wall biosynthesis